GHDHRDATRHDTDGGDDPENPPPPPGGDERSEQRRAAEHEEEGGGRLHRPHAELGDPLGEDGDRQDPARQRQGRSGEHDESRRFGDHAEPATPPGIDLPPETPFLRRLAHWDPLGDTEGISTDASRPLMPLARLPYGEPSSIGRAG